MVPPDVAKAGWGREILNTIILNHKENSTKLSSYANKPPSTSPERVVSARRPVPAFRAGGRVVSARRPVAGVLCQRVRHPCTASRCQRSVPAGAPPLLGVWGVHDSPIVYSLLREGSHPPHPLTAERSGAIFLVLAFGAGYVIARAGGFGAGQGFRCLMLRRRFGVEGF